MKENKLIEMANKIETVGQVLNQIIQEMKILDERVHGMYMFIQQLPNYEEIVEQLKEKAAKEESEDGTV